MADHRDDRGIVDQLLGDAHRDLRAAAVVHGPQRQRPSADPPARVDFFDRQLCGAPHRDATRLGERTRESENDRTAAGTRAGRKRENRGKECQPAHERGKVKPANGIAQYPRAFHITCMDPIRRLCGFAAGLERLLAASGAAELETIWSEQNLGQVGWEALALARRANTEALEPALAEVDRRLLAVLERSRAFLDPHIVTFRVPELERWQHAAAAALVGARWGVAGLRTVIADTQAPLGRRYFAFLALAERHPKEAWPLFAKYLQTPRAHHAFVAAAVEAARYYPGHAPDVIALFQRIRGDEMLRRFLAPKILESLYVLGDPAALPLYKELLIAGHTDPDAGRCEVTRALVGVRKLTGRVAASSKFPDPEEPNVRRALDEAQRIFEEEKDRLEPVVVI